LMLRIKKEKEEASVIPAYTVFSASIQAMNIFVSRRIVRSIRPTMMYMLIMAVVFGSWGMGVASAESIPGELLYKVKRAKEGVELAFTAQPKKSQKRLEIVSERIEEKKQIVRNLSVKEKIVEDEPGKADKRLGALASLDKDIQKQLELAKENLDQDVQKNKDTTNSASEQVGIVVDFNETVIIIGGDLQNLGQEIKNIVEKVKKETNSTTIEKIKAEDVTQLEKAHEAVETTLNKVQIDAIKKAVEVAVSTSEENGKKITETEEKKVIQEVVNLVTEKVNTLSKNVLDSAKVEKIEGSIEITKEIATPGVTSSKQVAEDLLVNPLSGSKEVKEVTTTISENLKTDLSEENLQDALERLKQLQTANETKEELDSSEEKILQEINTQKDNTQNEINSTTAQG